MTRDRINALHREAAELVRDGRCAEHLDREIALLKADSDQLTAPVEDASAGVVA